MKDFTRSEDCSCKNYWRPLSRRKSKQMHAKLLAIIIWSVYFPCWYMHTFCVCVGILIQTLTLSSGIRQGERPCSPHQVVLRYDTQTCHWAWRTLPINVPFPFPLKLGFVSRLKPGLKGRVVKCRHWFPGDMRAGVSADPKSLAVFAPPTSRYLQHP